MLAGENRLSGVSQDEGCLGEFQLQYHLSVSTFLTGEGKKK